MHPISHNLPMDRSEPDAMYVNTCASVASLGSSGMSSVALCVDVIVVPFGRTATTG